MSSKRLSNICTPICSVTDLIRSLGLSRARFYQLQKAGISPPPVYDLRTHRPFFDAHLQEICNEIRQTGIGFNGQYILFYSCRKNNEEKAKRRTKSNPEYGEMVSTLNNMGLTVNSSDIERALRELYPEGYDRQDMGIVIRQLFRFLKDKE